MLFVGTSIIHPSTEGVFLLCNILDLLIYSTYFNESISSVDGIIDVFRESQSEVDVLKRVLKLTVYQKMLGQAVAPGNTEEVAEAEEGTDDE